MAISHSNTKNLNQAYTPQPQQQVFVVDDPTAPRVAPEVQSQPMDPQKLAETQAIYQQMQANMNAAFESKKQNAGLLENLILLGRVEDDVVIGGMSFKISTLTGKERAELNKLLASTGDQYNILALTYMVAYALKSINGLSIENVPFDGVFNSLFEKKLAITENLQQSVLDKLFLKYTELSNKSQELVDGDEIKK